MEYKECEISNSETRLGNAVISNSESESEMEEPPEDPGEIENEKSQFEAHLDECLSAIRSEELDGIAYGIVNLAEAFDAHPEYIIEALDDTNLLNLMCYFIDEFNGDVTPCLMHVLHIFVEK